MPNDSTANLFTFVLEFLGGTYVAQATAPSLQQACVQWVQQIDVKAIKGLGVKSLQSLAYQITKDPPVKLEGLHNVWCLTAILRGKLALIQIIQTDIGGSATDL